jgi:SAM-dependent methyltransferase
MATLQQGDRAPDGTTSLHHGLAQASEWVVRWSHLIPQQGTVLDIACGHGRHMQWLSSKGHLVTGIDRSPEALSVASRFGEVICADIENQPWPLVADGRVRQFDAVIVTNYLWRSVYPIIVDSLAAHGVLIYETFAIGNETVGKPTRSDFLLNTGELLEVFSKTRVVAFEDGFLTTPDRFVQRIAAIKLCSKQNQSLLPQRYPL